MTRFEKALRDIAAELPPRPQLPLVIKIAEIVRKALNDEPASCECGRTLTCSVCDKS
jgi:hypothetical protein